MKAKEFLNKVMRGDKTTIRKNTGIIGFDEKENKILSIFSAELLPNEIMQIITHENNPIINEYTMAAYIICNQEIDRTDTSVILDNGEPYQMDIDEEILIDDTFISTLPEETRDYFIERKGLYVVVCAKEWPNAPISYGQHSLVVNIKNITIYNDTFTIEE